MFHRFAEIRSLLSPSNRTKPTHQLAAVGPVGDYSQKTSSIQPDHAPLNYSLNNNAVLRAHFPSSVPSAEFFHKNGFLR